ncbi:hypothetical protein L2E82_52164 [Cichorium intybus]|nr:hypothetical protein L2E82_52164 [Cichorium intybus]
MPGVAVDDRKEASRWGIVHRGIAVAGFSSQAKSSSYVADLHRVEPSMVIEMVWPLLQVLRGLLRSGDDRNVAVATH